MASSKYTKEQADEILRYLTKVGQPRKIILIAAHMNMDYKVVKRILIAMKEDKLIHPTLYGQLMYFVGGADVIKCEEPQEAAPAIFKPLKVDRYRRELYADIDKLRNSIRSIR